MTKYVRMSLVNDLQSLPSGVVFQSKVHAPSIRLDAS
jgi:hypothetical protein